jgi:predicted Fe-Mo cluster-binding NifX family protein
LRVAIPRFEEEVAPCFEYSATIAIFTIENKKVLDQLDFRLKSKVALDRVRLLRDQNVDTLICGGMQRSFESLVDAQGIQVISWVSGRVDVLLERFIKGLLVPGSGR